MDDVIFVLRFIRDRDPNSLADVELARRGAFHERLKQRRVQDYQTIEANCLRDRGLSAEKFDALVYDWLSRGIENPLKDAFRRSYQTHDITTHPEWLKLFSTRHSNSPNGQLNRNTVRRVDENLLYACDIADAEHPERRKTVIWRHIRDTAVARALKQLHRNKCQICGIALAIQNGLTYSEAHHIQPLGEPHNGPDHPQNILILCPNHHALCDFGAIALDVTLLRCIANHQIDQRYIDYHNTVIANSFRTPSGSH